MATLEQGLGEQNNIQNRIGIPELEKRGLRRPFEIRRELTAVAAPRRVKKHKQVRVLFPTGVEVCHSMVHGGPFPATSDGRSTSVGTHAITRFTRLIAYQASPQNRLPDELKDDNPLGINRLVNGAQE